ncbi:hypothetical protein QBC39DRAFT_367267 [Podospora conica]|nr:hypothetical protein QBC39DRAFT_367267 [Schizothecium conicum]
MEPTIPDTSQVLLHEFMNHFVGYYNDHLQFDLEKILLDPVLFRQGVDNIVKTTLEDNKEALHRVGVLPLHTLIVAIVHRTFKAIHPFCLESEFQRWWEQCTTSYEPPFVDFEFMEKMIDSGVRPLDALHSHVVDALEPQFVVDRFEHRNFASPRTTARLVGLGKKYKEKLAKVKSSSRLSPGDSEPQASNDNAPMDTE